MHIKAYPYVSIGWALLVPSKNRGRTGLYLKSDRGIMLSDNNVCMESVAYQSAHSDLDLSVRLRA